MTNLEQFRQELDDLDVQLLKLLGKRFEIIRRVGAFKKKESIPMMQLARIEEMQKNLQEIGYQEGLDRDFVLQLYNLIIQEACQVEDGIIASPESC